MVFERARRRVAPCAGTSILCCVALVHVLTSGALRVVDLRNRVEPVLVPVWVDGLLDCWKMVFVTREAHPTRT